jgi:hypothetical protein
LTNGDEGFGLERLDHIECKKINLKPASTTKFTANSNALALAINYGVVFINDLNANKNGIIIVVPSDNR